MFRQTLDEFTARLPGRRSRLPGGCSLSLRHRTRSPLRRLTSSSTVHRARRSLSRYLPMARRHRQIRYARKPRGFTIPLGNTIELRQPEIGARTSFERWEGNPKEGRHVKSNLRPALVLVRDTCRTAAWIRSVGEPLCLQPFKGSGGNGSACAVEIRSSGQSSI